MQVNTVDELISDIRQGRMVVLLDDDADSNNEGVVMVAAEHCDAGHVNFMARQARGLVCLTLTEERCQQLDLPPMVDDARGEKSNFTLSIEATVGIDTGISAADRARTVQAAVAPYAKPADIVQPGHIFPLTAVPGGVLTRAGHTEAGSDYARLAGLLPAAVIADILTPEGMVADGPALREGKVLENSKEGFRQLLLKHFPDPDILLNKNRMEEREALARDNALPTDVLMAVSDTYVGIAEKITGSTLMLSDNPKAEIIDVLRNEFDLVD